VLEQPKILGLRRLIAALGRAAKNDQKCLAISKSQFKYKSVLQILCSEGFIQSFEEKGDFVSLRLKQSFWKTWNRPIKAIQAISVVKGRKKRHTFRASQVKKLQLLQGNAVSFIFSTNKGIVSGQQAVTQRLSGIPLLQIK